jgi:FixJ family two-component response regulator
MHPSNPPILVVDDDQEILDVLSSQIRLGGYVVYAAASPREAMEALRRNRFAAVISDYQMPGMSGTDLLACVREIQPDATRILITGILAINSMIGFIESGLLHRFLAKPWARVELIAAVEAAVQYHRLLRENERLQADLRHISGTLNAANAKVEILFEQLTRRDAGTISGGTPIREMDPDELRPGMRVASNVTSSAGLPFLEEGETLTHAAIEHLRTPCPKSEAARRVLVYEGVQKVEPITAIQRR